MDVYDKIVELEAEYAGTIFKPLYMNTLVINFVLFRYFKKT